MHGLPPLTTQRDRRSLPACSIRQTTGDPPGGRCERRQAWDEVQDEPSPTASSNGRCGRSSGSSASRRVADHRSVLLAGDGVGELTLGHAGAALDAERLRALVELFFGVALGVDATVGLLRPVARRGAALLGLRVARAVLVLLLPVVADLLGDVLDRRPRGPVRALLGVVLLVAGVERLLVGVADLLRRALERPRQVFLLGWHTRALPGFGPVIARRA